MKPGDLNDAMRAGGADGVIGLLATARPIRTMDPADGLDVDLGSWRPKSLADVDVGAVERPTLMPRGDGHCLLYRGKTHAIAGEPGSLKTWFALCAASSVLLGGGRVLYIDHEDSARGVAARLRALRLPNEAVERLLYVQPSDRAGVGVLDHIAADRPDLVVVDGVTTSFTLFDLDPNDAADAAEWHRVVPDTFARAGAAVLVVDHVVKNRDARGGWATGSGAKKAMISGCLYLAHPQTPFGHGRLGTTRIELAKDRPGGVQGFAEGGREVGSLVLSSLPDGHVDWRIDAPAPSHPGAQIGMGADGRLRSDMERVWSWIEQNPGCSTRRLEGIGGMSKPRIAAARSALLERGDIAREQAGKRCEWRTTRPVRAASGVVGLGGGPESGASSPRDT